MTARTAGRAAAPARPGPLLVMGAGSVGCYVGARLQAAGAEVHFVGRPRVLDALARDGLKTTSLDDGGHADAGVALAPAQLRLHAAPPALGAGTLALLCVKSGATAAAAAELAAALPAGTPVLSLQNGVDNAARAAAAAPALEWIAGMVPFNVAEVGPGRVHRGTSGRLAAQRHAALSPWLALFEKAGLPLALHDDLAPVQWGKLLLNLNNPVNALSGLPLRAELLDRDCRAVFAALMAEALAALKAAGMRPERVTALPPARLPALLRLPTPLFRRLADRMLRIDPQARSSMADDLALGRPTEIDAICGAVLRLAAAHGLDAPLNRRMVELLSVPKPQPLGPAALRRRMGV